MNHQSITNKLSINHQSIVKQSSMKQRQKDQNGQKWPKTTQNSDKNPVKNGQKRGQSFLLVFYVLSDAESHIISEMLDMHFHIY